MFERHSFGSTADASLRRGTGCGCKAMFERHSFGSTADASLRRSTSRRSEIMCMRHVFPNCVNSDILSNINSCIRDYLTVCGIRPSLKLFAIRRCKSVFGKYEFTAEIFDCRHRTCAAVSIKGNGVPTVDVEVFIIVNVFRVVFHRGVAIDILARFYLVFSAVGAKVRRIYRCHPAGADGNVGIDEGRGRYAFNKNTKGITVNRTRCFNIQHTAVDGQRTINRSKTCAHKLTLACCHRLDGPVTVDEIDIRTKDTDDAITGSSNL